MEKTKGEKIMPQYQFSDQTISKVKITDDQFSDFTLTGINGTTTDANAVMGGLSYLLDIVGWSVLDAVRIVNQDIEEVN